MSKADLDALRAELRLIREANARADQRLQRLEDQASVAARAPKSAAGQAPGQPELTVIKLKPKTDPAPRIDTRIDVVEPSPEILHELAPAPAPRAEEAAPTVDESDVDAEYEQGVSALKTGNVEGGVARLLAFASTYRRHPKADNALYFAGLGQMGLEDFGEAARTFDRLVTEYPAGDAVQDALLKQAECRIRLHQLPDAKALYTKVVLNYPGTAAATLAESRLASMH